MQFPLGKLIKFGVDDSFERMMFAHKLLYGENKYARGEFIC